MANFQLIYQEDDFRYQSFQFLDVAAYKNSSLSYLTLRLAVFHIGLAIIKQTDLYLGVYKIPVLSKSIGH